MPRHDPRLLLISPVYNESPHIERVVRAVACQQQPPVRWILVDDGSTDGTCEKLRALEREVPCLEVLASESSHGERPSDRLAVALEARAFNRGLRQAGDLTAYDYVGKLDGDIELPPHWFRELLDRMAEDSALGIVGATLIEPRHGNWHRLAIPEHHVHGAVKLYRRECFEAIDGMWERLAWDTVDETYARMRGYRTRSYRDLTALHLRPAASADGQLRGRARHGECAWILHYPLTWVFLRSLKVAADPPRLASGAWFLGGYLHAVIRRVPRVADPEFRRFTRVELRKRLRRSLTAPVGRLARGRG